MNNCLVVKLKDSVDNSNLKKIGEFSFGISGILDAESNDTRRCGVRLTGITKARIEGSAYFTDSSYTENYGQEFTSDTGFFYMANTATDHTDVLIAENKYGLIQFGAIGNSRLTIEKIEDIIEFSTNLSYISFSPYGRLFKGDLEKALYNNKVFTQLGLPYNHFSGALENIVKRQYEIDSEPNLRTINGEILGSSLTLNGQTWGGDNNRRALQIVLGQDTATISGKAGEILLATYTRSTDSWTYTGN